MNRLLHHIANAPPRYTTIMVAGSGGAGISVGIVKRPPSLGQKLARWLLAGFPNMV